MVHKVIAIDGPSASGKSTIARRVASELGCLYVDSGSLYRGVTWKTLREGIRADDACGLTGLIADIDIDFFSDEGAMRFSIDGIEPGQELRTEAVDENVSRVSAVPGVRFKVVAWLRDMIRFGRLVMEGRDIGTAVFPDAEFKFYLDASPEERARRRYAEMGLGGGGVSGVPPSPTASAKATAVRRLRRAGRCPAFADSLRQGYGRQEASAGRQVSGITVEEVRRALERRDAVDSSREVDPLGVAPGAIVIDSTLMSIEEVVQTIVSKISPF